MRAPLLPQLIGHHTAAEISVISGSAVPHGLWDSHRNTFPGKTTPVRPRLLCLRIVFTIDCPTVPLANARNPSPPGKNSINRISPIRNQKHYTKRPKGKNAMHRDPPPPPPPHAENTTSSFKQYPNTTAVSPKPPNKPQTTDRGRTSS